MRWVQYIDLSRVQPIPARTGYSKLAKPQHKEKESKRFEQDRLSRYSEIMGRHYESAKMSITDADLRRSVPGRHE